MTTEVKRYDAERQGKPHICPWCHGNGMDPSTVHPDPCPMCEGARRTFWEPWKGWRARHAWYCHDDDPHKILRREPCKGCDGCLCEATREGDEIP